jgi:hypothetical protein
LYHALSSLQQIYTMQKKNWVFCFQDYAPFFSKDMCSIPHHVVWCIISQDGSIGSQFSLFIWYRWNLPITQHAWVVSHCCQVPLSPSCFKESESWYRMIYALQWTPTKNLCMHWRTTQKFTTHLLSSYKKWEKLDSCFQLALCNLFFVES